MDKKPTDAHLIRVFLSERDRAFQKLFDRYEKPLFSFIYRYVKNRHSAEDIFQQTWLKVLKGLTKYREEGKFSSWLFGIAHNCCIDHTRQIKRSKKDDSTCSEGMDRLKGDLRDPESDLLKREQSILIEKAIDKLPDEQKEVVLMRLYGDLPFKEIAEILNSPLNTVLGRMHYAVRNLRKQIRNDFGEDFINVLS
jgi:RNA polymerase sigma-70 factor (ECF subfamily)